MRKEARTTIIEVEEHHSSMGTAHSYKFPDGQHTGGLHIGTMGFRVQRGDRFQVTVERLPPAPGVRPRKNPFLPPQRRRQK